MPQQFFSYTGPAAGGKTVNWLSAEEAFALQAKEDQMKKDEEAKQAAAAADVKLAPVVNKAVSDYAQAHGVTQADMQGGNFQPKRFATEADVTMGPPSSQPGDMAGRVKVGDVLPATALPNRAIATDPLSARFDEIQAGNEDVSFIGPPAPVASSAGQMGGVQTVPAPSTGQGTMLGMRDDIGQAPEQPKNDFSRFMGDLPEELVMPLIIQYNQDPKSMPPSKVFAEITRLKKEMYASKELDEKERKKNEAALALERVRGENDGYGGSLGAEFKYTQDHPEVVAEALGIIDSLRKGGKYSEDYLKTMEGLAQTRVSRAMQELGTVQGRTESAVRTLDETTEGRVKLAGQTAAAIQRAKTLGLKPLDAVDEKFMLNTRSAYDDVDYARSRFKDSFATPYLGGVVKISAMKQLSPEFADFIGSLERGVSKQRVENFGTAQTGTELANLKDYIDKDMAVTPKVLLTQVDKFLATAKRDYNDRIGLLEGQKVYIPDGYEKIGIEGGMSPNASKPGGDKDATSTGVSVSKLEEWARDNPNDPRAAKVLARLGLK
jgi:hypothetical protein